MAGCRIKRCNYDERIIYPGYPGFLLHGICITETGKILKAITWGFN
jgi:hypothetical protein